MRVWKSASPMSKMHKWSLCAAARPSRRCSLQVLRCRVEAPGCGALLVWPPRLHDSQVFRCAARVCRTHRGAQGVAGGRDRRLRDVFAHLPPIRGCSCRSSLRCVHSGAQAQRPRHLPASRQVTGHSPCSAALRRLRHCRSRSWPGLRLRSAIASHNSFLTFQNFLYSCGHARRRGEGKALFSRKAPRPSPLGFSKWRPIFLRRLRPTAPFSWLHGPCRIRYHRLLPVPL